MPALRLVVAERWPCDRFENSRPKPGHEPVPRASFSDVGIRRKDGFRISTHSLANRLSGAGRDFGSRPGSSGLLERKLPWTSPGIGAKNAPGTAPRALLRYAWPRQYPSARGGGGGLPHGILRGMLLAGWRRVHMCRKMPLENRIVDQIRAPAAVCRLSSAPLEVGRQAA